MNHPLIALEVAREHLEEAQAEYLEERARLERVEAELMRERDEFPLLEDLHDITRGTLEAQRRVCFRRARALTIFEEDLRAAQDRADVHELRRDLERRHV